MQKGLTVVISLSQNKEKL
jgi:hypothetical protein